MMSNRATHHIFYNETDNQRFKTGKNDQVL